jgi:tetratricopeptide (TPR) repeat protein
MKILRAFPIMLALACFQAEAAQLNQAAEALMNESHVLRAQGKNQEAFNKLAAAASADPAASLPLSGMANMLADVAEGAFGDEAARFRRRAEDLARQALKLEPNDPVAQEVLRNLEDGKPLPLHQPSPAAAALLHEGEVLFTSKKPGEALIRYERAAQLDPQYSTAWIYAGDCFFVQQNWVEAEKRFRKGVEVEPLNAQGWRFLADALIRQDKRAAAEEALIGGIAAQPSQLPNWGRLAQMREAEGYPLTRLRLVRKARGEIDPASGKLNITIDPAIDSSDMSKQPDGMVWLALATQQALSRQAAQAAKAEGTPFTNELASWRKGLAVADKMAADGIGELTDPALKTMQMLAKADQLEVALLLLQYKESYRPEFEAWKKENPNGIRKFINTYGLQP